MKYDFDVHSASGGIRGGVRIFDRVALEGLGGVSSAFLDIEVRGESARRSNLAASLGYHFGSRLTITPHPVVDVFAEGRFHRIRGLEADHGTGHLAEAHVGANLHLTPNLSLFGGWRWAEFHQNVDTESDLDIDLSGPAFGMLVRF